MGFIIVVFAIVSFILLCIGAWQAVISDETEELRRPQVLLPLLLSFVLGLTSKLAFDLREEYNTAYQNWQRSAQLATDYKEDLMASKMDVLKANNTIRDLQGDIKVLDMQVKSNIDARIAATDAAVKAEKALEEAQVKLEKIQGIINKGESK